MLMNFAEKAKQLKTNIPAIFLCLKDKDTPLTAKILAWLIVGYALSPIDLIPDFIPILGYLDDVLILSALIALTIRLIPKETFDFHQAEAREMWADGKPKKMVLCHTHCHRMVACFMAIDSNIYFLRDFSL